MKKVDCMFGSLSGKGPCGQKSPAMPDAAKKPVVAAPVKPVLPPPADIRIEIPLDDFLSACKLMMRRGRDKRKTDVEFTVKDGQFMMEWGGVGSIVPGKGMWPGSVSIRGSNFLGVTKVPPRQNPVVLEVKNSTFCVDGFTCACSVSGKPKRIPS